MLISDQTPLQPPPLASILSVRSDSRTAPPYFRRYGRGDRHGWDGRGKIPMVTER